LVNKFIYGMTTPDWVGIPYTEIGFWMPWVYRFPSIKEPEPYDVIIFRFPDNKMLDYIKRCIATPGQAVQIHNKNVYVNKRPFKNPPEMQNIKPNIHSKGFSQYTFQNLGSRDNYGPITIPDSMYWAMGDNRDNSADSRYWGFLPRDHIVGKALIIYFSINSVAYPLPNGREERKWEFPFVRGSRIGNVIR